MKRIIRKCLYCQDNYFLKFYGRRNISQDVQDFVKTKISKADKICDFCMKDIFVAGTRPYDNESFRLIESKRIKALFESRSKKFVND